MSHNKNPQTDNLLLEKSDIETFVNHVVSLVGNPPDLVKHTFTLSSCLEGYFLFLETVVDKDKIEDNVLRFFAEGQLSPGDEAHIVKMLQHHIPALPIHEVSDSNECAQSLLEGRCLLMIPDVSRVLVIDVKKFNHRPVSEPQTEKTVRGPREAFIEDLTTNIGLLRKRIRTTDLRIEQLKIGSVTETKVIFAYMQDLASDEVVSEVRKRIQSISVDSILDSSYVEEWIEEKAITPFPTLQNTERPDVVASHLLEGSVAVLVDGSPNSLIGPFTFMQNFTAPEDYYQRAYAATLFVWLRYLAFVTSVFVPAFFIAVVSYHQDLLPTPLLINIEAQREGVPFPAYMEAFGMLIIFEMLREGGLRMPRISGQAISIVGALVLGTAAVEAGLVSAAMVIVVSVTGIANFSTPYYSFGISQRILQYFYMLLASFAGLFGMLCGFLLTIIHLASLKSFGVPYLSPIAPTFLSDWKDTLVRVPRPWMNTYPRMNHTKRRKRQS